MKKWYEYNVDERVKNVYSKYTISDFWNWWSDGIKTFMEVRTTDWKIAKDVGYKLNLFYSHTGVFVSNNIQLKNVIKYLRDNNVIWFGIQPRKFGYNKWGKKALGGQMNFIDSIKFIFLDIDRKIKTHPATNEELKDCDIVCDSILSMFGKQSWSNSYIKICSGNGVQCLIKLDIPIKVPNVEYTTINEGGQNKYIYLPNNEFNKVNNLLRDSVGKDIEKYTKKFCKDNNITNVEIDKTCFRMAQVGALHCTKNFKFIPTWRAIVDMKNGVNDGLSDYLYNMSEKNIIVFKTNIFGYNTVRVDKDKRLIKGKIKENKLVKFMLENEFPEGGINNTLWFQLKCLLRDYKVDLHGREFLTLHEELKQKHRRTFTLNIPDGRFMFDENIVNRYCINNCLPPLYDLWANKTKNIKLVILPIWGEFNGDKLKLDGVDIFEDMKIKKHKMIAMKDNNELEDECYGGMLCYLKHKKIQQFFISFVLGCISKYGENKTKYFYKYVFDRYFNYE